MTGIRNILIPTDLSLEADQALGQAIFLAQMVKADVHLLHVMPGDNDADEPGRGVERVHERMEAAAARRLEPVAGPLRKRDVMLHTRVIRGMNVVPAVLAYAAQIDADLIVMGTRGRRARERHSWQSHAEEIARLATSAVLTVGRGAWSMPGMIRRVLVPIPLDGDSVRAIHIARRFAFEQDAEIDLLHVMKPNLRLTGHRSNRESARIRHEQDAMDRVRAAFNSVRGPDVRYQVHLRIGDPEVAISEFARSARSDLIVVTSRGNAGVRYALEGSTAAAVVGTAPCPVLTLKNKRAAAGAASEAGIAGGVHNR